MGVLRRSGFGTRKIADIKYSEVKYFYNHLMNQRQLSLSSLDNIHTILHPAFELAVGDNIIRNNPSAGVMAETKRRAILQQNRIFQYVIIPHNTFRIITQKPHNKQ
ncbi:MAG: hypothetical protein J6C19_05090 [Lachnospiraceae bacterium]|nr:hypothetical protein [Lachnospiraceae bacterium]